MNISFYVLPQDPASKFQVALWDYFDVSEQCITILGLLFFSSITSSDDGLRETLQASRKFSGLPITVKQLLTFPALSKMKPEQGCVWFGFSFSLPCLFIWSNAEICSYLLEREWKQLRNSTKLRPVSVFWPNHIFCWIYGCCSVGEDTSTWEAVWASVFVL